MAVAVVATTVATAAVAVVATTVATAAVAASPVAALVSRMCVCVCRIERCVGTLEGESKGAGRAEIDGVVVAVLYARYI